MMSEQAFDDKVKAIETEYKRKREGADAWRDQEVARLFIECGWTQVAIGKRMGWTHGRVSQRLVFGRFLNCYRGNNSILPPDLLGRLTERRFRDHWSVSKKNRKDTEEERFARVLESLRTDYGDLPRNYGHLVNKPGIKPAVVKALSEGPRRTSPDLAECATEILNEPVTREQVNEALKLIRKSPPKGMALDERHTGKTHKYRLVERQKPPAPPITSVEDASACAAASLPLIEECIEILKKPVVGRQYTLALDHLWRVQRALQRLFVAETVI